MSLGSTLGGALGGIGGFLVGGPPGATIGAALGSGLGDEIDGAHPAQVQSPYTSADALAAGQQSNLSAQQQQAFLQQLQAQGGAANQSNVFNQLGAVASGQGPNPAQAMLANSTGANVANQAALMAGQRGAGANSGLMARQIAMQGANTQQQAAGQGAALQANQSLNALGQQAGIAGQQVGQQQQAQSAMQAANQNQQNAILNSIAGANTSNVAAQTPLAVGQQGFEQKIQGGVTSGIGALATALTPGNQYDTQTGKALNQYNAQTGEMTPQAAAQQPNQLPSTGSTAQPITGMTPVFKAQGGMIEQPATSMPQAQQRSYLFRSGQPGFSHAHTLTSPANNYAQGGQVAAMVSPGEKYLPPAAAQAVAQGAKDPMSAQTIPGTAKVKGDSLKNDTVPMTLEEGGVVIPRSVLESKNPHEAAARFVAAHLKKSKR